MFQSTLQKFILSLGVAKREAISDFNHLEYFVRHELNQIAYRVMVVLDPIKLVIENYPENKSEMIEAENNPENKKYGNRFLPFSKELYIERQDFMESAPKKFYRLSIGKEVRLKHAYYIKCTNFKKDDDGNITEVRCTYDPLTKGGWSNDGRKVRGTIHWVSLNEALDGEIRLYNRLFNVDNPLKINKNENITSNINTSSLNIIKKAKLEPSLNTLDYDKKYQFLRKGYFILDKYSNNKNLIFNQTVELRDTWKKSQK